jgi:hypothetical protein
MSLKQLDNLVRIGKLKTDKVSEGEIAGLVRSGNARLKDAANSGLSIDSRFDLAYNAAHALALAALRRHGYRSENRYLVFQCLEHTLQLQAEEWRVLAEAHRRRNIAEYEGGMDIDKELVAAIIRVAKDVSKKVGALIAASDKSK